jgi:hypothetical protein
MTQFEFRLSDEDTSRIFALKEEAGKDDLTANDYARELLIKTIHRLYPEPVKYDENTGERIRRKKGNS